MTVQDNLKVLTSHWIDEVTDLYQCCYREEISWNEFCNYAINAGFDGMTQLKNFEWEEEE